jgi:prolyl 4-hydroxylase
MQNIRNYIENNQGLEIFTIPNFLNDDECDYLCNHIEINNTRSTVAGSGLKKSTYDNGRTSNTSVIPDNDPKFQSINNKMYEELGIASEYSEPTQGQIYQEGQYFNYHNDYFDGDGYTNHCLASGQRTWTFMIYLNDVEEGGETDFPRINQRIAPQKGTAVVWKNSNGTGSENPAGHHSGLAVVKGKKMIITKWFRENMYNSIEDERLATEYHNKNKKRNFNSPSELPKLSPLGFKVVKVPENTWRLVKEAYNLLQSVKTVESWNGITDFIHDNDGKAPVEIFNMDHCFRIKEIILEELKPLHQEFAQGRSIEPFCIYGIRS